MTTEVRAVAERHDLFVPYFGYAATATSITLS